MDLFQPIEDILRSIREPVVDEEEIEGKDEETGEERVAAAHLTGDG